MRFSMSICQQQARPAFDIPTGRFKLDRLNPRWQNDKVVVIMGATGTGKSRLSIDLATQFPAEVINSDKMQVYEGLDVVTNKITEEEKSGVPHHLLGTVNPNVDFTAADFCESASGAMDNISNRGLLPIIVGGSNSFVEALVDHSADYRFPRNYDFCFIWVDVALPVLYNFVSKRVDQMVKNGLIDEVRNIFDPCADYSRGIRKSIGVPELDRYLRSAGTLSDEKYRARLLQEAISDIKNNTCKLACRQLGKIRRLRNIKGWNINRLDATEVFRRDGEEAEETWEKVVGRPSAGIVGEFLYNVGTPMMMMNKEEKVPAIAAGTKEYMSTEYNAFSDNHYLKVMSTQSYP